MSRAKLTNRRSIFRRSPRPRSSTRNSCAARPATSFPWPRSRHPYPWPRHAGTGVHSSARGQYIHRRNSEGWALRSNRSGVCRPVACQGRWCDGRCSHIRAGASLRRLQSTFKLKIHKVIALRAVQTEDFMTADWYVRTHYPYHPLSKRSISRYVFPAEILRRISSRITNEVAGINRVTYDISSKPPAVSPAHHVGISLLADDPLKTVEWL
jgi:hypothetical protein